MGLILFPIYIVALALVSIVSIRLATKQLQSGPASYISSTARALYYVFGSGLAIVTTSLVAWWFADLTTAEWGRLFRWVGISLVGPLVVAILLSALSAIQKKPWFNRIFIAGAFHATLVMPVAGLAIVSFYDDIVYKPAFNRLCANAQPVVLEKVAPAKSFALLSWWLKGDTRSGSELLLATGSPLQYIDVNGPGDRKITRYTLLQRDERLSTEKVLEWREIYNDPELVRSPAEYEIEAIKQPAPVTVPGAAQIHAYRIEIRRTTDKKVTAFSDAYASRVHNWECPVGIRDGSFIASFIATALELPKH